MKLSGFRLVNKQGDTIIEVLLAMTLLTLILFTSWGLVNRSTQLSLAARKRIDMVNQLKEQAEILKSKFAETGSSQDLVDTLADSPNVVISTNTNYEEQFCIDNPAVLGAGNRFYYASDAVLKKGQTKEVSGDANSRIWIEYSGNIAINKYADFYIRGCWLTSGGNQKTDSAQLIVRLNK